MIVLDTSALLAALVDTELQHDRCRDALAAEEPPLLLSPFVLAELAYLLAARIGVGAELDLLEEVARGAYDLEPFVARDVAAAHAIVARYRDLSVDLADASVVVLAERRGTNRVFTLDERRFRALRPLAGGSFLLLPADG